MSAESEEERERERYRERVSERVEEIRSVYVIAKYNGVRKY